MADGDSILGAVADAGKDLVRETVKQVVGNTNASLKSATQQVAGFTSEEDDIKKKTEQAATFQRIKAIEAEMAQIARQNAQKKGPDVVRKTVAKEEDSPSTSNTQHPMDEASRQAVGRAEQGRNFKG
jgi:hypothetical protein